MTKCANCVATAVYEYKVTEDFKQYFCVPHLPGFLRGKTAQSMLVSIIKPTPAPKPKKQKTVEVPTEE
jgi:hypothetical protein